MSAESSPPTARDGAFLLLLEWDRAKGVRMDHLVHGYLAETDLGPSDRGMLMEICYGAIRHRNTLRFLAEHFCFKPLGGYHRTLRTALAMGLYQAVYMRTPPHAVVDTSVKTWNRALSGEWGVDRLTEGRGFLNATLRTACDKISHQELDECPPDDTSALRVAGGWARVEGLGLPELRNHAASHLGLKYSHPPEMVRVWSQRYDDETLRRILVANNTPPPTYLVLRRHANRDLLLRKLQLMSIECRGTDDPQVLRLEGPGAITRLPGYREGDFWVQDYTSRLLAMLLPEREHATLLDLCSAPGGKLATLLDRSAYREVRACDLGPEKIALVQSNLERLDLGRPPAVQVFNGEADPDRLRLDRVFDQVLVDVPCSNSGVLSRRHEARWRLVPEKIRELQRLQLGLLTAGARHVAPGGDLLYATCSIEPSENSDVAHTVLRTRADLQLIQEIEILPGEGEGDGGYAALFRRR